MTKRRRTVMSKRARPKLPEGDEGHQLSKEDRQKKLGVFLEDFDSHVERIIAELHKITKSHCNAIDSMEKMDMIALPKNILDMKLSDFLKVGNVQAASLLAAGTMLENEEKEYEEVAATRTISRTAKRPVRARKQFESIDEEEEDECPSTLKPQRTTRRATTRGKQIKKENMPAPVTTEVRGRTSRRAPMTQLRNQQTYCDTPLVTPRFDPRLVNTPGYHRHVRPKEKTLCMTVSETGSPVKDESTVMVLDDNQFFLVNENGEKQLVKVDDSSARKKLDEMKQFIRSLAGPMHL